MSKKSTNRKTAEDAIKFLDQHLLDPTPGNYTFAYLYLTGVSGSLRKTVDEMTYGGVRLRQEDVEALMNSTDEVAGAAVPADIMELQTALRHQALSMSDLTQRSLRDAGAFGRDLNDGVEQMLAGADMVGVIRAMIARTAEVERKLAETAKETERLRMDLDAAREDATRDALTNLPNRRAADRRIEAAMKDAKPLSLAFCDIDHFKSINDRFGHDVGDRVLKVVADTLSEALQPHVVARFGGEEFVVIMPEIPGETAYQLLERARKAVAEKNFRVRETDQLIGQVTLSAGIATTGSNPEAALKAADQSLYEAKNGGRNRTVYREAA